MKLTVVALILFGLVTVAFADDSLPKWVLQPPTDSAAELIGVGEGTTIESATTSALNAIAAKLYVTVRSEFKSSESLSVRHSEKRFTRDVDNQVQAKVEDIQFGKYRTLESYQEGDKKYVMVAVDRQHFTEETAKNYDDCLQRFNEVVANLATRSILQTLVAYQQSEGLLPKAKRLGSILRVLGEPTRDGEIKAFEAVKTAIGKRIRIVVEGDDDLVRPAVEKYFNDMSLRVVKAARVKSGKDVVFVKVSSEAIRRQIYGSKMVRLTVSLQIADDSNTVFNSYQVQAKGASVLSFDEAMQAAVKQFQKNLRKASPATVFGSAS